MRCSILLPALLATSAALTLPALAQTVKVTPLGGIDGEFCPQDRALVFEELLAARGDLSILFDRLLEASDELRV